jgi:hypothetical protein
MDNQKEGTLRILTAGEIKLSRLVYGSSIHYEKVFIHKGSYLPFGLQNEKVAMTPNGEIYFREYYKDDFSKSTPDLKHTFIHEMGHVWQREKGMNVIGRGLVSWLVSYRYKLDGRLLDLYPMEQQAQIISDHFTLVNDGYKEWLYQRKLGNVTLDGDINEAVIGKLYKNTLRGFPW